MFDSVETLESQGHPKNLDFLRFALAVLVIYSHSYALLSGGDESDPLFQWSRGQISWGGLAVDAFFILSGYLITFSWMRSHGLGDFLRKRVLRIYPAFIVAVTFGVLVTAVASDRPLALEPLAWFGNALRLRGYSPEGAFPSNPVYGEINGSLWSIAYEFWCYIGVALLGVSSLLLRRRLVLGLWLATIAVSLVFLALDLNPGIGFLQEVFGYPPLWARLLPYYLAGCVCYLFRERIPLSWGLFALLLSAVVASVWFSPLGVALIFPFALSYVLLFFSYLQLPLLPRWGKHGDFSYGLYLYAFPVQQLLVQWRPDLHPLTLFAMAFVLTLLLAMISWHVIEKPYMALKSRRKREVVRDSEPVAQAEPIQGRQQSV